MLRIALLLATLLAGSSKIPFHVESADQIQSYLPVHILLKRADGQTANLPQAEPLQCSLGYDTIRCDGVDYRVRAISFEVSN